ncbi:hypothetical protein TNCV_4419211 [Trichonephila clavipes]|nr:hypothetical protein TNCV_4419211 [Trichonephila clavipes]
MTVQFRNEKVSNHGSIPITIDCKVVAFIVFEEGFHQPIKRTKQEGCQRVGRSESTMMWICHRWMQKEMTNNGADRHLIKFASLLSVMTGRLCA